MSALLNQAIATLNLQPGQTYRTTVNGHDVEVRVLDKHPSSASAEEPSQFADMVMLQPWFAMPEPAAVRTIRVTPGQLPLPDPPIIPPDDELPEDERANNENLK